MALLLHERAVDSHDPALMRLVKHGLVIDDVKVMVSPLLPDRELPEGEQYRFHFDMTECIGCRPCEVACNEGSGNAADILWRLIGEFEGGTFFYTQRHYLSMGCNHCHDADCLRARRVNFAVSGSIKALCFIATNPVVAFRNRSDLSRAELQTVCGSYG